MPYYSRLILYNKILFYWFINVRALKTRFEAWKYIESLLFFASIKGWFERLREFFFFLIWLFPIYFIWGLIL
jgi:hypothetical protein